MSLNSLLHRRMCNDLRPSTAMPNRKQSPTISTLMLDVLEPSCEVGDTPAAETETAKEGNNTVPFISSWNSHFLQSEDLLGSAARNKLDSRHLSDSAHWAVHWRGTLLQ
jgi:hypothetical protein